MATRESSTEAKYNKFWAEARNIGNYCTTAANDRGISPYEKRHDEPESLAGLPTFGTVGSFRVHKRKTSTRVVPNTSYWTGKQTAQRNV